MLKNIIFIFLSLLYCGELLAMGTKLQENRPDAATNILAAFQGSCGSQGVFTRSAQAQTQSIIDIINALKDTDACKPYANQLATIQAAAQQVQSLQSNSSYASYQADQQNYQLLTLALQNANPAEAPSLQEAINALRVQMFSDQATWNATEKSSRRDILVAQTSSLLSWGQQLTLGSSGLGQCLQQSPVAALELGTNLAAYGGSFLPGVFGAGVGIFAQLINTGLESLRVGQYNDALFQAHSSEMPDALSCALESMTESYCNAEDSFSLLDLAAKNRLPNFSQTPLWGGIDILSRQLPALLQWLGQIQNEVPPQDSYQAAKQNSVFQEILQVEEQNLNAIAAISNALDRANAAATEETKLAIVVNAIANLSAQLVSTGSPYSSPVPTPFSIYQPNATIWACWLVLGVSATCPAAPDQNMYSSTVSQVTDYLITKLGLNKNNSALLAVVEGTILNNWNHVLPNVQALVDADFARIIATNAGMILSSARVPSNGHPIAPYKVLQNISNFLAAMIQYGADNPQLGATLMQEKQKVDETIHQLTASDQELCPPQVPVDLGHIGSANSNAQAVPLTPAQCQVQRLVTISNLFELKNGTQVFLADMNGLVNIDLQNRFAAGEMGSDTQTILRASGQDLAIALQSAGIGDLDPIADDLASARADIEENIQVFRQFFVKAFQQVVQREASFAAIEPIAAGANRPHGQRLGELCMLWLLSSNIPLSSKDTQANWPDLNTQELCRRAVYFNENQSSAPAFTVRALEAQVSKKNFEQRVCTFHQYKLKNKANTRFGI